MLRLSGVRYLIGSSGIKMIVIPDNACVNSSIFCAIDTGNALLVDNACVNSSILCATDTGTALLVFWKEEPPGNPTKCCIVIIAPDPLPAFVPLYGID